MTSRQAQSQTPLAALRHARFLRSSWPWRGLASGAATLASGCVAALAVWPLVVPLVMSVLIPFETRQETAEQLELWIVVVLPLLGVGLLLLFGPLVAIPAGVVERWRLQLVHPPIRHGHRTPPGSGLWSWLRTRYRESATWYELTYLLLLCVLLAPLNYLVVLGLVVFGAVLLAAPLLVAFGDPFSLNEWQVTDLGTALPLMPIGAALLVASLYACALTAQLNAVLGRVLLGGERTDELHAELIEVTRSRARLVGAFEAERRRIERDLHDGTQQRLVALAMQLGLARMDVPSGSAAESTLASAHDQAKQLIGEMREIIRGIHPQLLVDQGLPAALSELTDRFTFPVELSVDLPERLPSHVEATGYFAVAEALTNVAKHTTAHQATVTATATATEGTLVLDTTDDGPGGADPNQGTGLTGLADRVSVTGGRIMLSSPSGGPTRLRVEIPCEPTPTSEWS